MPTTKKNTRRNETDLELFSLLKKDHRTVRDLLKQISEERSNDVFEQVKEELEIHMRTEEEHFYPLLKDQPETETMALEAFEEHNLARSVIDLISDEEDDKVWLARVKVLTDVIEHHVQQEEGRTFPAASKNLDREELKEAGEKIKEMKNEKVE